MILFLFLCQTIVFIVLKGLLGQIESRLLFTCTANTKIGALSHSKQIHIGGPALGSEKMVAVQMHRKLAFKYCYRTENNYLIVIEMNVSRSIIFSLKLRDTIYCKFLMLSIEARSGFAAVPPTDFLRYMTSK